MLRLQEALEDEQESLRLFYVAVTRAADHLILSAGRDPGGTPQSPWMRLLDERFSLETGLPKHDPLLATMTGTKGRAEIPDVFVHREPPKADRAKQAREHRLLNEFETALANAAPEPLPASAASFASDSHAPRSWSVSDLEKLAGETFTELKSGHGAGGELKAAEELGTLIHGVLERVDFAQPADWERWLGFCLRGKPAMENSQIDAARAMLQRFMESDIAKHLARATHLWREVNFTLPWPDSARNGEPDLIGGQIDCCYIAGDGTWQIIDYKTGDYSRAGSDAEIIAPYRLQLGLYALAVEDWWGRAPDALHLVIFRPEVRLVTWTFDAAARAQLRTWVDDAIRFHKAQR
jgi:ATP-dependent helicase/nuclease subunit A